MTAAFRASRPQVPWEAIDAARAEAATAVATLLDLTGPVGLDFVERDATAYITTRLAMVQDRDCGCEDRP